jgi:SAM-dependent methyltransferase
MISIHHSFILPSPECSHVNPVGVLQKRKLGSAVEGDCVVCNMRVGRVFSEEPPYTIVECAKCKHIYTFPRPLQADVDERYQGVGGWISAEDPELAAGAESRYSFFLSLLKEVIPPPANLLDVGCSIGRFLELAQKVGYECYGVEPGTDAEHATRSLGAGRIHRKLYREPIYPRCDIVTMFEVLEHIPDPRTTLQTVHRQLKTGAWFLGSVPGQAFHRLKVWPRRRFGVQSCFVPLTLDPGNHLHYYSTSGLKTILSRAGFETVISGAAPADYNYLATSHSASLKRLWSVAARLGGLVSVEPLSTNIWFLCRKSIPQEQ